MNVSLQGAGIGVLGAPRPVKAAQICGKEDLTHARISARSGRMTSISFQCAGAAPDEDAPVLSLPPMLLPASGRRWVLRGYDAATARAIGEAAGVPFEIARLLAARGQTAGSAADYLNPSLKRALPDPSSLADMDAAAERLAAGIMAGETCGVFGDYDVDGTCGAAILKLYFDAVGGRLEVYLPDRLLEGYGPTIEAFRALK
ncbi:MAG TPA: hypothetical protein DDZ68_10980, partial [Parvularcula sp.]|nr:hypothetical protein [Parvularcula sp.]